ncbi:hypothetical protein [Polluticoccus soli]|uniref:hypothetical protein n=1 Tax=Polluticoccus soli TaxID=3034150 RepID=UPI0023E0E182|nr:hypothetical protein [Flavipsychrobacter sp. JY13-12]
MRHAVVVILLFLSQIALAQKPRALRYYSSPRFGLCTGTIDIYNDNSYAYESGCEETSHISFGKWRLSNDTVYFTPFNNKTFKLIDTVITSDKGDDSVSVVVFDKYNVNVTHKIDLQNLLLGDPRLLDDRFSDTSYVTQQFPQDADSIVLFSLERIFEQNFRYVVGNNKKFIVKLNIPSEWLMHPTSDWNIISDFGAIKRADGNLETFTPNFWEKQVFVREKKSVAAESPE